MAISYTALSLWAEKGLAKRNFIYNKEGIIIFESSGLRCLTFGEVEGLYPLQGCIFEKNPQLLVFDYTKFMIGGLFLNPNPSKILILGLGIGSIPLTLAKMLPNTRIDVIEIDKRIVYLAEKYFGFRQTEQIKVKVEDAYNFIINTSEKYDIIFMDVFDNIYIPAPFLTSHFMESAKEALNPGGIFIINTFTSSTTYKKEEDLIKETYGGFLQFLSSNRIMISQKDPISIDIIQKSEKKLRLLLKKAGIDSKIMLQTVDKSHWQKAE